MQGRTDGSLQSRMKRVRRKRLREEKLGVEENIFSTEKMWTWHLFCERADYRWADDKEERSNVMNWVAIEATAEILPSHQLRWAKGRLDISSCRAHSELVSSTQRARVEHAASSRRACIESRHGRLYSTRNAPILEYRAQ